MFRLQADKTKLALRQREQLTSGSVNVYPVRFEFSPDWDGLTRTAVFKAGSESRSVLLDESGACSIPWEVLAKPNVLLEAPNPKARCTPKRRPSSGRGSGSRCIGRRFG